MLEAGEGDREGVKGIDEYGGDVVVWFDVHGDGEVGVFGVAMGLGCCVLLPFIVTSGVWRCRRGSARGRSLSNDLGEGLGAAIGSLSFRFLVPLF